MIRLVRTKTLNALAQENANSRLRIENLQKQIDVNVNQNKIMVQLYDRSQELYNESQAKMTELQRMYDLQVFGFKQMKEMYNDSQTQLSNERERAELFVQMNRTLHEQVNALETKAKGKKKPVAKPKKRKA